MQNFTLNVRKVDEAGYDAALLGLSYNKKKPVDTMESVAKKLAFSDGGHNKFLESIIVWLEVQAPRYWWQEADTFRLATKQSESTMHTLRQELLAVDMNDLASVEKYIAENFEPGSCDVHTLGLIQKAVESEDLVEIKKCLPEGFLQKRLWCMSYKTLRNIILQRRTHRLPHWKKFIADVLDQLSHAELLPGLKPGEVKGS